MSARRHVPSVVVLFVPLVLLAAALAPAALAPAAVAAAPAEGASPVAGNPLESSVVSLSITYQGYIEDRPWAKENPAARESNAVVVEGPLLLTTARYLLDATFIQATKRGRADRFPARIVHMDPEIDLAVVAVDDPAFFADLVPARLADVVPTSGTVLSARWRNRQFEVSNSRVSRVEVTESTFGMLAHLKLWVRSDLAGGGWSEPIFDAAGRLLALTCGQDEQQASAVPVEILRAYLDDARSGRPYRGFAGFGVAWQINRDAALARHLGLAGPVRGIVVRAVPWGSTGCGVLRPQDLLLAVDGHAVDAEGYYEHPRYGRLRFTNLLVDGRRVGDVVPVRVLRGGKELDLDMPLRAYPTTARLVPWRRPGTPPAYLVAGGFAFRELDAAYLRTWGKDWRKNAPLPLMARFDIEDDEQRPDRRRFVVLMFVLPDEYNIGYDDLEDLLVGAINGRPVDSIEDVEEAFRHPVGGFHTVTFLPNGERDEAVLDAATFEEATARILETYRIPERRRLSPAPPPEVSPACAVQP